MLQTALLWAFSRKMFTGCLFPPFFCFCVCKYIFYCAWYGLLSVRLYLIVNAMLAEIKLVKLEGVRLSFQWYFFTRKCQKGTKFCPKSGSNFLLMSFFLSSKISYPIPISYFLFPTPFSVQDCSLLSKTAVSVAICQLNGAKPIVVLFSNNRTCPIIRRCPIII